jgi:hypothetical protein
VAQVGTRPWLTLWRGCEQRRRTAAEREGTRRGEGNGIAQLLAGRVRYEDVDPLGLGEVLEPGSDVHRVSHDGVFAAL